MEQKFQGPYTLVFMQDDLSRPTETELVQGFFFVFEYCLSFMFFFCTFSFQKSLTTPSNTYYLKDVKDANDDEARYMTIVGKAGVELNVEGNAEAFAKWLTAFNNVCEINFLTIPTVPFVAQSLTSRNIQTDDDVVKLAKYQQSVLNLSSVPFTMYAQEIVNRRRGQQPAPKLYSGFKVPAGAMPSAHFTSLKLKNGTFLYADGSKRTDKGIFCPSHPGFESRILTLIRNRVPSGSQLLDDGCYQLANGAILFPSWAVSLSNGQIRQWDGTVRTFFPMFFFFLFSNTHSFNNVNTTIFFYNIPRLLAPNGALPPLGPVCSPLAVWSFPTVLSNILTAVASWTTLSSSPLALWLILLRHKVFFLCHAHSKQTHRHTCKPKIVNKQ